MNTADHFKIALSFIPNIGVKLAKDLVENCGSEEAVFREKRQHLERIPQIGPERAAAIASGESLKRAEREIHFMEKNNIGFWFFNSPEYPELLSFCRDSPVILYYRGDLRHIPEQKIAIVGTRKATIYGKEITGNIIEDMKPFNPLIISGLAYGIDTEAHRQAVKNELTNIAVVAHGLDQVYPKANQALAKKIEEKGALISEFPSGTYPDAQNFPKRNRIIAGMSHATIVVEAAAKGGALITAEIANSYNREVFAIPGRLNDPFSEGCNHLIKSNQAGLYTGAKDLKYLLNWKKEEKKKIGQTQLFIDLNNEEQTLINCLSAEEKIHLDTLSFESEMPISKLMQLLLELELKGAIKSYPGKHFGLA